MHFLRKPKAYALCYANLSPLSHNMCPQCARGPAAIIARSLGSSARIIGSTGNHMSCFSCCEDLEEGLGGVTPTESPWPMVLQL